MISQSIRDGINLHIIEGVCLSVTSFFSFNKEMISLRSRIPNVFPLVVVVVDFSSSMIYQGETEREKEEEIANCNGIVNAPGVNSERKKNASDM